MKPDSHFDDSFCRSIGLVVVSLKNQLSEAGKFGKEGVFRREWGVLVGNGDLCAFVSNWYGLFERPGVVFHVLAVGGHGQDKKQGSEACLSGGSHSLVRFS